MIILLFQFLTIFITSLWLPILPASFLSFPISSRFTLLLPPSRPSVPSHHTVHFCPFPHANLLHCPFWVCTCGFHPPLPLCLFLPLLMERNSFPTSFAALGFLLKSTPCCGPDSGPDLCFSIVAGPNHLLGQGATDLEEGCRPFPICVSFSTLDL